MSSNEEIVARTILREAFEKGNQAYEAVAWVIYNRVKSPKFPSNDAKTIVLQNNQFAVWRSKLSFGEVNLI